MIPGKALVPYPPELNAVEGAVARANGLSPDELYRGALCMGDKFSQSLAWDRIMQDRMRELSKEKARLRDMLDAADARRPPRSPRRPPRRRVLSLPVAEATSTTAEVTYTDTFISDKPILYKYMHFVIILTVIYLINTVIDI